MKTWKFVALWTFILISGELILYGRYYILFYKPHGPFKLVRALHSDTLGVKWGDERYGWYYTIQYVEDVTLEDISISWRRSWYDASVDNVIDQWERMFIEKILPGENFTISTRYSYVDVQITYHKGITLETEEIEWEFDVEDAVEVISASKS